MQFLAAGEPGFGPVSQATPRVDAPASDGEITRILSNWDRISDPATALLPLVYEQLRAIASNRMRGERRDHTLQATALVHEAYLKLARLPTEGVAFESRGRFFAAAAEAMRRILIDSARRRSAVKRGAAEAAVSLDALPQGPADLAQIPDADQLLALDEALEALRGEDPRAAEVVRLRYFAGLSAEDTAEVMGLSVRTVGREWAYARARLHEMLRDR